VEETDAELVVVEVIATQLVEEEDAEVEVAVVTTQLVKEDAELVEADAIVVAEMEADTEGKKRRCASMALRRNTEVPWEKMSEGQ
jgi:predicted RNA methylase